MKSNIKITTIGLAIGFSPFLFSCDQETRRDADAEATEIRTEAHEADHELGEFSTWVDQNTTRAEMASREEWQEIKNEYNRKEAEFDAKASTWDDKAREEWLELKRNWKSTEENTEARLNRQ